MTLYEFIVLDDHARADALWSRGVHIGSRGGPIHSVLLYQLDGFYVEVYYRCSDNVVTRLRPFSSTHQLEPYLQQIDLTLHLK